MSVDLYIHEVCRSLWRLNRDLMRALRGITGVEDVDDKSFWDRFADEFARRVFTQEYAETYAKWQISRINIRQSDLVLDVGCGPGRLAIPIARTCRIVYAVDYSKRMIEILMERARQEGVESKIVCVCKDWLEVEVGRDVPRCDVVIASHVLEGIDDVIAALRKIVDAALREAHVFMDVLPFRFVELVELCKRVYGHEVVRLFVPRHAVAYLALSSMDVSPNVEIHVIKLRERVSDVDELIERRIRRLMPFALHRIDDVRRYVRELTRGSCTIELTRPVAHIWWRAY